ncbi:hypothetical protein Tco_0277300 [Tanacetum coccineum]
MKGLNLYVPSVTQPLRPCITNMANNTSICGHWPRTVCAAEPATALTTTNNRNNNKTTTATNNNNNNLRPRNNNNPRAQGKYQMQSFALSVGLQPLQEDLPTLEEQRNREITQRCSQGLCSGLVAGTYPGSKKTIVTKYQSFIDCAKEDRSIFPLGSESP